MKQKIFKILLITFLLLNIIFMLKIMDMIYFTDQSSELDIALQKAHNILEYNEKLAKKYGIKEDQTVRNILSGFSYEIEKAQNIEQINNTIFNYGSEIQKTLSQRIQNKNIDKVIDIINSQQLPESGSITISQIDQQIIIFDPDNILQKNLKQKIKDIALKQTIEIKIEDNQASVFPVQEIFNHIEILEKRVDSLEKELNNIKKIAGFEQLTGKGIKVEVYDIGEKIDDSGIVHDSDLRDIINELFIAGARGIQIGQQRLTATSTIRCVGPTIFVNNKPIRVNPVVIYAVGEPDILSSSLDIIKDKLNTFGIEMKILKKDEIKLEKTNNSWREY